MKNLISIIIPVYKVEKELTKCLDSVLNQTYKNIEVILVDDGSPDNCPQICDNYKRKDGRIKVLHQKNAGVSAARNAGLAIAKGDCVGFVDSDDVISPNMYEILYSLLQQYQADIASCLFTNKISKLYYGTTRNIPVSNIKVVRGVVLEEYIRKGFDAVWQRLYTKKTLTGKLFEEGVLHDDSRFSFLIMQECRVWVTVKLPLYYWNLNTISLSRSCLKTLHTPLESIYQTYHELGRNKIIEKNLLLRILRFQYRLVTRSCLYGFKDKNIKSEYYKMEKEIVLSLRHNYIEIIRSPLFRVIDKIQISILCINLSIYKRLYTKIKKYENKNNNLL